MTSMRTRRIIWPLIVLGFLGALYFPTLRWLINSWLYSDYYSHGFLVLPIAGAIVWARRKDMSIGVSSCAGIWLLCIGLVLHVMGFLYISNFISAISFLIVIVGIILYFWGHQTLRVLAFPICFLIFMIPLPFLDKIGFWMQSFSASASAGFIDLIGIQITRIGAEIHLEKASFVIGMPCSGMNGMIALLALGALFAYMLKGPFIRKAMLFLLAVPVAIFANLFRLVGLLLIGNHWGGEVAAGFLHDAFSPVFFIVAIICLVILARILRLRMREEVS